MTFIFSSSNVVMLRREVLRLVILLQDNLTVSYKHNLCSKQKNLAT